jgi:polysaccharide export outer membrane protein
MCKERFFRTSIVALTLFVGTSFFKLGCSNPVAHVPELDQKDFSILTVSRSARYRLVPYDVISIKYTYHSEQDPKAPIAIGPDGNIMLEGLGAIRAAGLSSDELGKLIAEKSSSRLKEPEVIVTVAQYAPRRIYVGGEVKNPGIVLIQEGMSMTPLQAIFDRGGFTTTAQMDSVILIRDAGSEKPKIGRLNLSQSMENAVPEQVTLLANDVVYIPMTGIGRADLWVRQHLREIIPTELFGLGFFFAGS